MNMTYNSRLWFLPSVSWLISSSYISVVLSCLHVASAISFSVCSFLVLLSLRCCTVTDSSFSLGRCWDGTADGFKLGVFLVDPVSEKPLILGTNTVRLKKSSSRPKYFCLWHRPTSSMQTLLKSKSSCNNKHVLVVW